MIILFTDYLFLVIQGADSSIVEELINRGSLIDIEDVGGITLSAAAKLLKGRGLEFPIEYYAFIHTFNTFTSEGNILN